MRSVVALVVVLIALVSGTQAALAVAPSGISGIVIKSPTKPVCEEGVSCSAPAGGVTLVFTRVGVVVGRATTAGDGTFRLALAPGGYLVRTVRKWLIGGFASGTVDVRPGRFTRVSLSIDTGIR